MFRHSKNTPTHRDILLAVFTLPPFFLIVGGVCVDVIHLHCGYFISPSGMCEQLRCIPAQTSRILTHLFQFVQWHVYSQWFQHSYGEVGSVVTNPDNDTSHPNSKPLPFSPLPYVSQKTCQLSSVHSQGLTGNVGHLSLTTVVQGGMMGTWV